MAHGVEYKSEQSSILEAVINSSNLLYLASWWWGRNGLILFFSDQVHLLIISSIKGCIRNSCACSRSSWCSSIGCSISNYDHRSKWVNHYTMIYVINLCNSFKYPTFRHWGCCFHARWSTYRASVANRREECRSCLSAFECRSWGSSNGSNDRL